MDDEKQRNFAIFIDGDNTSPQHIGEVINIVKTRGKILIKRVYGDFSQDNMKNWYKQSLEHSLEPIQVWRIKGKQSSDLKITADCIELMIKKDNIDNYALITGDGDFITLINKLKMNGKYVIGFSQSLKSTSEYLPNTCDEFIIIERVIKSQKRKNIKNIIEEKNEDNFSDEYTEESNNAGDNKDDLIETLKYIMDEYESDIMEMSTLKERLLELNPTFSELNFGFQKFGQLINSIPGIEIIRTNHSLFVKRLDKQSSKNFN